MLLSALGLTVTVNKASDNVADIGLFYNFSRHPPVRIASNIGIYRPFMNMSPFTMSSSSIGHTSARSPIPRFVVHIHTVEVDLQSSVCNMMRKADAQNLHLLP